jgi:hypothetical protein
MVDLMVAVTRHAPGESGGSEYILVRTRREQLRLEYVAIRADVGDLGHPRRRCAVVAVASGAGHSSRRALT